VNNMAKAGNRRAGVLRGDRAARVSAFDALSSALSVPSGYRPAGRKYGR
jgi:hypothetical protein